MAKLTRYKNFEVLKSVLKSVPHSPALAKSKKAQIEFEAFLNLLRSEYSGKKKSKTFYGK
jgi:hypothetical protein